MNDLRMFIMRFINKVRRNRDTSRLAWNIVINYFLKGAALLVSLLLTPAYMNYFSSNKLLGMWFTALSVLNWLMLFDFGIGGGVRNQIVEPLEHNDRKQIKEILSAAYFSVGGIVLLLYAAVSVTVRFIDWNIFLGVTPYDVRKDTLRLTVYILITGIVIRFFCVLVSHIFYALQAAFIPNLLTVISNILILLYMQTASPCGNGRDLIYLAVAHAIATNLPSLCATVLLFVTKFRDCLPDFRCLNIVRIRNVLMTGTGLFYLQILITLLFGVKDLFITWFVGSEQVVNYNIYQKLIGTFSSLFSLALSPVWSAVTKAYVTGNFGWIRKLYQTGTLVIGLISVAQFGIIPLLPWLSKLWLGEKAIEISFAGALIFCCYNSLYMWVMMNYNFFSGLGKIRMITITLSTGVFLNAFLSWFFCHFFSEWFTVVASTAVAIIPAAIMAPREIRILWDKK